MRTTASNAARRNIASTLRCGMRTGRTAVAPAPVTVIYGGGSNLPPPQPTGEGRNARGQRVDLNTPYTAAPAAPVAAKAPRKASTRSAASKARDALYQRNKRAIAKAAKLNIEVGAAGPDWADSHPGQFYAQRRDDAAAYAFGATAAEALANLLAL